MAVVASSLAKITPIFREPGLPIFNPSITHRWSNVLTLTGDATGGGYDISTVFPYDGALGQFLMWDWRFFGFFNSAAIAGMTSFVRIVPGDPEYPTGTIQISFQNDTYRPYQLFNALLPDMKFKISVSSINPSQVAFIASPNTNGVAITVLFGGYLYDERMI